MERAISNALDAAKSAIDDAREAEDLGPTIYYGAVANHHMFEALLGELRLIRKELQRMTGVLPTS
jgi:hypothetical protein